MFKILVIISVVKVGYEGYAAVSQEVIAFDNEDDANTAFLVLSKMKISGFDTQIVKFF
jgi:hypothetical protein